MSVPMMAWVSGNVVHVPLDQPITQEMLKGINRAYSAKAGERVPRDDPPRMWCSTTDSWVPTPSPGMLFIQLPLTEIPAVLLGNVPPYYRTPIWTGQGRDIPPLSKMASGLYDLPWIWAQGIQVPRRRLETAWGPTGWFGIRAVVAGDEVEEDGSNNHVALGLPAP